MRKRRQFKAGRCYHLVSRIANRAFFLTDDERTRFVDRRWRVAWFSFTPPMGPRFPITNVF